MVDRRSVRLAQAFLALLLVAALFEVEWWPVTGWRLFSSVRTGTQSEWEVVTVAGDTETPVPFGSLPRSYRSYSRVLAHVADRTAAERDAACAVWAEAARQRGAQVDAVRAYRLKVRIATSSRPRQVTSRTLTFECADP